MEVGIPALVFAIECPVAGSEIVMKKSNFTLAGLPDFFIFRCLSLMLALQGGYGKPQNILCKFAGRLFAHILLSVLLGSFFL
jgi:hypothetical protein